MDICVCGAQVPFMQGGAEQLMRNLVQALEGAGHRAELVRLPSAWDRERIFDAALAWRLVPLDVDLVIATNFPSYFVRHPNKVVWLLHQHRVAYDDADGPWSDFGLDDESLEAQRILTEWDQVALGEARARFTLSAVVADRLARTTGLVGEPLPHPPPLFDALRPGAFSDTVFTATRLEANKRPELLLEALAHTDRSVRAAMAGTGTHADALAARAAQLGLTDRFHLLGYVSDDELVKRFASALAVVYTPRDEDYGYVTLQAFRAGKPVITTSDSGGVLEWVDDGVNGFVTDPAPEAVAAAIDALASDRALAEKMGAAARERVAELSWEPVVQRLVGAAGAAAGSAPGSAPGSA